MTLLHSSSGRLYCSTDAKVQVVLPQLHELRLVALHKQLSRNRKQWALNQGNLNTDLVKQKRHIDKELKIADDYSTYITTPYRKSLTHVRGVQQCLLRHRTELSITPSSVNFGHYGGLSVKSLTGDIDKIMKDNSYQNVKMRYCKRILSDGKTDGRIMNFKLCVPMLDAILNRPKMAVRKERPLGFEGSDSEEEEEEKETVTKRPARGSFVLPPVTASRLFSPAKSRRRPTDAPLLLDRATTIA